MYGHIEKVNLSEYAEKLVIDPNDLGTALLKQANLYYNIAQYASCAIATAERCKQQRDVWLAERIREVRDEALEAGSKRPPGYETMSAEAVTDPKYAKLQDLYIDAKQDASILENARDAMKMRQFMLGHLVGAQKAESS